MGVRGLPVCDARDREDRPGCSRESRWVRGDDLVLDVACGNGNATIPAAKTGATTTGLDLTPELLEAGREAAAEAGVEIDWVEGDAQDMPFDDASFDVVTSVFGCMFAPDQRRAAAEIARVLRPGGRMVVCAWTPEGNMGKMFMTVAAHRPPPPEGFQPPVLWGNEEHVRELFDGTGVNPETRAGHGRIHGRIRGGVLRGDRSRPPADSSVQGDARA